MHLRVYRESRSVPLLRCTASFLFSVPSVSSAVNSLLPTLFVFLCGPSASLCVKSFSSPSLFSFNFQLLTFNSKLSLRSPNHALRNLLLQPRSSRHHHPQPPRKAQRHLHPHDRRNPDRPRRSRKNSRPRRSSSPAPAKSFCAGMDLDMLRSIASQSPAENQEDSRRIAKFFRRLWSYSKPLIAAVNGHALAGGCGIATLCDFTLAVPEAKFGYTEVKIGFLPAIVSVFLTRQIGEKRARDLLLTGRLVEAAEAKELGLVNELVAPELLMYRAHELAATLIAASPASVTRAKHLLISSAIRQPRSRPRARHPRKRPHALHPRFPRRPRLLPRKAQTHLALRTPKSPKPSTTDNRQAEAHPVFPSAAGPVYLFLRRLPGASGPCSEESLLACLGLFCLALLFSVLSVSSVVNPLLPYSFTSSFPASASPLLCVSLFSSSFNSQLSTLNPLPLFRHTIPTTHAHSSRCHRPRPLRRNRSNGRGLPLQFPDLV